MECNTSTWHKGSGQFNSTEVALEVFVAVTVSAVARYASHFRLIKCFDYTI